MSRPTLPGGIPGLLRFTSPVRIPALDDLQGVVVGTYIGGHRVLVCEIGGATAARECANVVLDLSENTGRAHAAWWVHEHSDRLGEPVDTSCVPVATPHVGVEYEYDDLGSIVDFWIEVHADGVFWRLDDEVLCEGLADDLDRADTEALRRVVLHLASLATEAAPAASVPA